MQDSMYLMLRACIVQHTHTHTHTHKTHTHTHSHRFGHPRTALHVSGDDWHEVLRLGGISRGCHRDTEIQPAILSLSLLARAVFGADLLLQNDLLLQGPTGNRKFSEWAGLMR